MIRLGDRDPELLDMWFARRAREQERLNALAVPTPGSVAPMPSPVAPAGSWAIGFAGALHGTKAV